jgi:hypothetical protein
MDQESLFTANKNAQEILPSAQLLGATRLLVDNTKLYVEYLIETVPDSDTVALHESDVNEFLKHFYEVAAPQLPEAEIDKRLFGENNQSPDPIRVLTAIQAELTAWQRGGVVESQREPLYEFTTWLLDAQKMIVNQGLDNEDLARCLRRGIATAIIRLRPM